MEPEIDLNDDERLIKEKRIMEIKKMIALQTLQQMNLDDNNHRQSKANVYSNPIESREYEIEVCYEKEKKAREHVKFYDQSSFDLNIYLIKNFSCSN